MVYTGQEVAHVHREIALHCADLLARRIARDLGVVVASEDLARFVADNWSAVSTLSHGIHLHWGTADRHAREQAARQT